MTDLRTDAEIKVALLKKDLQAAERRLQKIDNMNVQYGLEPVLGTVLKFSRNIAGGTTYYTFVAVRTEGGWSVSGRKNALNAIGLRETGNSWDDLRITVGRENVLWEAKEWGVGV